MSLRERIGSLIAGRPLDRIEAVRIDPDVFAASRDVAAAPSTPDAVPLSTITRNSSSWFDLVEAAGKLPTPTERTALTVSAIYAAVNLIAGTISALPVNIYHVDVKTGERDRAHDDDLHWIFNEQMSTRWSAASGWEFLCQSLLLHGDAFAVINRRGAVPIGLTPIHPRRVTVGLWPDGSRLVYAVEPEIVAEGNAGVTVYDQDDILHVAGFGFDGMRGLSPLRHALRMTGASAIAMQDFSGNFFANSARPDYALSTEQKLTQQQLDDLRQEITDKHQGIQNAHRPMLLHGGLRIEPITMPIKDMELVAMRQFQIEEIARIYGVPPFMIGHNEKTTSWGSGVEAMAIGFVRFTLRQHLNKFLNEMNRKLFRTASRVAEFDTTDLQQADTKSLFESLRTGVGRAGEPQILAVNEARSVLRLKRTKDGDKVGINPGKTPEPEKEPAK